MILYIILYILGGFATAAIVDHEKNDLTTTVIAFWLWPVLWAMLLAWGVLLFPGWIIRKLF